MGDYNNSVIAGEFLFHKCARVLRTRIIYNDYEVCMSRRISYHGAHRVASLIRGDDTAYHSGLVLGFESRIKRWAT